MKRSFLMTVAAAALALVPACAPPPTASVTPTASNSPSPEVTPAAPSPNSAYAPGQALAIAAGAQGQVWFVRWNPRNELCLLNPGGDPICTPTGDLQPQYIAVAGDGAVWAAFQMTSFVGRLFHGKLETFDLPNGYRATDLVAGPDGRMWFAESPACISTGQCLRRIAAIDVMGNISEYDTPGHSPVGLIVGSDHNIWFNAMPGVGRMSVDGEVAFFNTTVFPGWSALGADGNIWFTADGAAPPVLGCVTPLGDVQTFPFPDRQRHIGAVARGPDGAIWFDSYKPGHLGRITPDGTITEPALPWPDAQGTIMASAPGGIWLSDGRTIWWFVP